MINEAVKTYSDITGRYTNISSRGNKYIVIFYDYGTNIIHVIPTKTHNTAEILYATISMLSILPTRGNQLNLHILDNDSSSIIKQGLLKNNIKC